MVSVAPTRVPVSARCRPKGSLRLSSQVAPTSGNRPMPVSGMASTVRSVTTRKLPWADTPTPPPITTPSISAT